ncbi:MAG TPA: UDP-N-acetylglucosamine 2-epimerase [candidate division Zixibacteria bacterium]|nr:UDP-N-acetylglucosamine 2-epimerase [candidate division Zixibacteria bacterium]
MKSFKYPKPDFIPPILKEKEIRSIIENSDKNKWILMVAIGTKPDFYKQAPLIYWANKKDIPVICATTGQHYDDLLGYGIKEFKMNPLIDLQIKGDLLQKSVEIFYKIGHIGKWLREEYPNRFFLPIPHGDTLTAGIVSAAWILSTRSGVGQNEAGIRGMHPVSFKEQNLFTQEIVDVNDFIQKQWNGKWEINRAEPWPEQWDTFVSGAGAAYLFAPHEICRENLLREGYPENSIRVVGNSVVDAIELVPKPETSAFEDFPSLENYDNWIRVDVHRRGNLTEKRFKAIVSGVMELVKKGVPITWCELNATKSALEFFNLRKKILQADQKYDNFIFTPLWKEYGQVIEFWKSGKCFAELTDSGSIQEELNEIQDVLCLTLRFNTDRPESVFDAKSNVLVPPASSENICKIVDFIRDDNETIKTMRTAKRIYGERVGEKIMDWLLEEMTKKIKPFSWAHERIYGQDIEDDKTVDFM